MPNQPVMWGNYSFSNQGIVLEFETDHHFFYPFMKVKYSSSRPESDLSRVDDFQNNPFDGISIVTTKSDDWEYEEEYRVYKMLQTADRIEGNDSLPICLFKFPPKCLTGIIFGLNTTEEIKIKLKDLVSTGFYSNVKLYKMIKPNKNDYELEVLDF